MLLFVIHIASNFFSHFKRQLICPLAFFSYFIGVLKIFQLFSKNIPFFFNCHFPNSLDKTLHISIGLSFVNYAQKISRRLNLKIHKWEHYMTWLLKRACIAKNIFFNRASLLITLKVAHDQCSGLDRKVSKSSHLI